MDYSKLEEIFHPESVAVVGASKNKMSSGYAYTKYLIEHFEGKIYPINPNLKKIFNLEVYSNLKEVPTEVDYAISCIPAEKSLKLLEDCQAKEVKLIHLFTARMSETGREEKIRLERKVLEKAKEHDIRLLGPNCMGIYNPKAGLAYGYNFPKESGSVGAIFQSGGASTDLVHYGSLRGLRFSKVFSYGNALDIDESELLRYLADDPETEEIAIYVEGVDNGRKFIDALSYASRKKPVVVLKGGRSEAGARSIQSHTASLAGSTKIWSGIFSQCNAVEVPNFQGLIDQLVAFRFLPKFIGNKVLIAGGGGGKSVFSADIWGEEGFELPDLPLEMRNNLKEKAPEVWDWLSNPVDFSILQDTVLQPKEILEMFEEHEPVDLFILNITTDDFLPLDYWKAWMNQQLEDILKIKEEEKPVAMIAETAGVSSDKMEEWRWEAIEEVRKKLIDANVAVFDSPQRAARSISRAIEYYEKR